MILAASINDNAHRLIRDFPDLVVNGLGAFPTAARVDQDHALIGDDNAESGIVAKIFWTTLDLGADQRKDIAGDGLQFKHVRKGGQGQAKRQGEAEAGKQRHKGLSGKRFRNEVFPVFGRKQR